MSSEREREIQNLQRLIKQGVHPDGRPATLAEEARAYADLQHLTATRKAK